MMVRVPYTTTSGEHRVYEYAPPVRVHDTAAMRCRRVLSRYPLHLVGLARWRSGPQGQQFQNATVQRLIASGHAIRNGDVVVERVGFLKVGAKS